MSIKRHINRWGDSIDKDREYIIFDCLSHSDINAFQPIKVSDSKSKIYVNYKLDTSLYNVLKFAF